MQSTTQATVRALILIGTAALTVALLLLACGSDGGRTGEGAGPEASGPEKAEPAARSAPKPPRLSGGERLVFFGDSLAIEGSPNYPELLPGLLGDKAPGIDTVNLSEPGTTSADWRPGAPLFEERLRPELREADWVVVTVGGNDLQEAVGGLDGIDALRSAGAAEATARLAASERRIGRNLRAIFERIRQLDPGMRIAYVSYPDYSRATVWSEAGGTLGTIALRSGLSAMLRTAQAAGPDVIIDLLGPTSNESVDVDALLADSEHLGPAGHEFYAEEVAAALSGSAPPESPFSP